MPRKTHILSLFSFLLLGFYSCFDDSPNLNEEGENILTIREIEIDKESLAIQDTVYVPIYSDIYTKTSSSKILLTATLSIRNTSFKDTLFINAIDYYNSAGELARKYIKDKPIFLSPMESIEYVIEQEDNDGGTGANFIIDWGSRNPLTKPVFQGVMISTIGQHGISFTTEGVSIGQTIRR